jgi:hypothetical protein
MVHVIDDDAASPSGAATRRQQSGMWKIENRFSARVSLYSLKSITIKKLERFDPISS